MTDILFCFDTEDFTSCRAADAILRNAKLLEKHGIRGNFCVVGLVAKQLLNWKRFDVIDALKYHEIATHSYGHSLHPTINEYTDKEDFLKAYGEFMFQETKAADEIRAVTGAEKLCAAVPPGNSKSYVAMYGYADMGIPAYCDTFADTADGAGVFFCNALHMEYFISLEELFYSHRHTQEEIIELLAKRKKAIIYNHPNIALFSEFWDKLNYDGENFSRFGDWKAAPARPAEDAERFYSDFDSLVRALKNDGRFRFRTVSEVVSEKNPAAERTVTRDMLHEIRANLEERFYPMTKPLSLCISDVFLAVTEFLKGRDVYRAGKVYGFLEKPRGITEKVRVSADALVKAAENLDTSGFLPPEIDVGVKIGPADYLYVGLALLCGDGGNSILLTPRPQQISLDEFPAIRDCSFRNTWIHSKSFRDAYLSERLRLQAWTLRK